MICLELKPWKVIFKPGWDDHFRKFSKPVQQKICKKLDQMEQPLMARGLRHLPFVVEEVGQYRIALFQDDEKKTKEVHFVGDHKQYEKWYRSVLL